MPPVAEPLTAPMREFLVWVAFRPRTESDAREAWQSHCPRFTLWEDAQEAGLIALDSGVGPFGSGRVRLSRRGQDALSAASRAPQRGAAGSPGVG
ncbi:MAG: hypothetical protein LC797_18255 [Chloroflexi bacterium]|nr:hypothetical protein [Chloroflexota bacterium]